MLGRMWDRAGFCLTKIRSPCSASFFIYLNSKRLPRFRPCAAITFPEGSLPPPLLFFHPKRLPQEAKCSAQMGRRRHHQNCIVMSQLRVGKERGPRNIARWTRELASLSWEGVVLVEISFLDIDNNNNNSSETSTGAKSRMGMGSDLK